MPCTSFSQARKHDGVGPGPLRDYDHLWGLPALSRNDRQKVFTGNQLLRFTIRLLTLCERFGIPYALENPYSSYAWHMPPLARFIRKFQPYVVHLDFCQFGECWKKPTTVMGNFWNVPSIARRCSGTFGKCSATFAPHVLAPTWDQLAEKLQGEMKLGKVDCTESQFLSNIFGIHGYPTLLIISEGKMYSFSGRRSPETLLEWAQGGYKQQEPYAYPFDKSSNYYMAAASTALMKYGFYIIGVSLVGLGALVCFLDTSSPEDVKNRKEMEERLRRLESDTSVGMSKEVMDRQRSNAEARG
eukprot:symbB.v1.2.014869.t1/scaffold1098.1/size138148/1